MDSFVISQLAGFSGIKPHTIRIWEKRYQALQPDRSEGNTRYYNSHQLKRLLNIVSLMHTEHKLQELCTMPDEQLAGLIQKHYLSTPDAGTSQYVSQLIHAGISWQEHRFQQLLTRCIKQHGLTTTYKDVIYPLLQRTGLMWAAGTLYPAQEHFITHLIRQKLAAAVDALPAPQDNAACWLLFLPEDEFHETGLLYSQYLLRQAGKKVIYLGGNVPESTLQEAITAIQPQHLLLFLVHRNAPEHTQAYLNNLRRYFKARNHIYVCGSPALFETVELPPNTRLLQTPEALEQTFSSTI